MFPYSIENYPREYPGDNNHLYKVGSWWNSL